MASNLYDETLEQVTQAPPLGADSGIAAAASAWGGPAAAPGPAAPTPVPSDDPIGDAALHWQGLQRSDLQLKVAQAAEADPERAAKVRTLADVIGLPVELVEPNYEEFARQIKIGSLPYEAVMRDAPALRRWLLQSNNAALALDDIPNLISIERQARTWAQQAWEDQARQRELQTIDPITGKRAELGWNPETDPGMTSVRPGEGVGKASTLQYPGYQPTGAMRMATWMTDLATAPSLEAAGFGGQGSMLYRAGEAVKSADYATRAFVSKFWRESFGRALNAAKIAPTVLLKRGEVTQGENGPTYAAPKASDFTPEDRAFIFRNATDTINGMLKAGEPTLIPMVIQAPAVTAAMMLLGNVGAEAGAKATAAAGGSPEAQEFAGAMTSLFFGALGAKIGHKGAEGFAASMREAVQAERAAEFYEALSTGVAESKTFQRAPEQAQQWLDAMLAEHGGSIKNTFVDTDAWQALAEKHGFDPAAFAAQVTGDAEAWAKAQRIGSLEIPTSRIATKLSDYEAELRPDFRLGDPYAKNSREAAAAADETAGWMRDILRGEPGAAGAVASGEAGAGLSSPESAPAVLNQGAAPAPARGPLAPVTVESLMAAFNATPEQATAIQAIADEMGIDLSSVRVGKGGEPGAGALEQSVYHGSPYVFEKFDSSKIGTGEGAQAYGHGLYFAEADATAREYQRMGGRELLLDGGAIDDAKVSKMMKDVLHRAENYGTDPSDQGGFWDAYKAAGYGQKTWAKFQREWQSKVAGKLTTGKERGALYTVDLPDPAIAKMLDWDAPLSEQPEAARSLVKVEDGVIYFPNGEHVFADRFSGAMLYHTLVEAKMGNAAAASKALQEAGIPGIKYWDAMSRGAGQGTRNYVVFDDKLLTILDRKFNQDAPGGPKASVEFAADGTAILRGLNSPDVSSGLHELSHVARRRLFDRAVAPEQRAGVTEQDILVAERWSGAKGGKWTRAAEEKFARGFERYLRDGQAPTSALAGIFEKFAAWLTGIYEKITGSAIDVTITPEMREVFDHLVTRKSRIESGLREADSATADSASSMRPLFNTPEEAGMTPEAFAEYQAKHAEAQREGREHIRQQILDEHRRELRADWKQRRAEVQAEVAADVQKRPVERARAAIERGTLPDGTPLDGEGKPPAPQKLSAEAIIEQFGEGRLARLSDTLYTRDGGIDPRALAEFYGYENADAFLADLETAPPADRVIRDLTDQRMRAEFPSMLERGEVADKAQEALANSLREEVIREELRALAVKLRDTLQGPRSAAATARAEEQGRARWQAAEAKLKLAEAEKRSQAEIDQLRGELSALKAAQRGANTKIEGAVPRAADLRLMAKRQVNETPFGDLRPEVFWSAMRKSSDAALAAAAKGDVLGAIRARQRELSAISLYREAMRARADVDLRVRQAQALDTASARARMGKAGWAYQDQIDAILDRFSFRPMTRRAVERKQSLAAWVEAQKADGRPIDLPEELLNETRRQHYSELTVDEIRIITDGLKQIVHQAKLKNRLLKNAAEADLAVLVARLDARARDTFEVKKLPSEWGTAEERGSSVASLFASHSKLSTLTFQFDGHQDGGLWWETFTRPLNEAATWERTRKQQEGAAFLQIVSAHYRPSEVAHWHDKDLLVPEIGERLSLQARLSVALNWGRQANRDRLLNDPVRQWKMPQIQAILNTLEKRDWDFAQAVWDYNEKFRPEIAAKQKRVTGVEPEWTDPVPVETKYGTYRGGYYHIEFDGRMAAKVGMQKDVESLREMERAAYGSATTRRGHLQTLKQNVRAPLRLDIGVQFDHIDAVIHDLAYHETLLDVNRVLRSDQIRQTVYETRGTAGKAVYDEFRRVIEDSASGLPGPDSPIERAFSFLRTGTQLSLLGFNAWTAMQQASGVFNGMADVGATWVLKGAMRWLRDAGTMQSTTDWIARVSPFMRDRVKNATMEIADVRAQLAKPGSWFDAMIREATGGKVSAGTMADAMMWHIAMMQRVADVPTWLGAYEKARATFGHRLPEAELEAKAVALADQAVRDTQGSFEIQDLARVERGTPAARLFTVFYHYGNTVFNTTAKIVGRTDFRDAADVSRMVADLSLLYVAPAMFTVTLAHLMGKKPSDDTAGDWFAQIAQESVSTAFNTMVGLRELGPAAVAGAQRMAKRAGLTDAASGVRGYEGPAGLRFVASLYRLGPEIGDLKPDAGFWKALNSTGGIVFKYPALQVQRTIEGALDLYEGKTSNPGVLLTGPGPKTERARVR